MRALVGGRIRLLLSGGAPLSPDTHDFVRNALSLPLVQGYGLTESCACGTIMDGDELTTGRGGPPLQGVEVKLINWEEGNYLVTDSPNPRGEIVIGGGNVATGYYKVGGCGRPHLVQGTLKPVNAVIFIKISNCEVSY